MEDKKYTNPLPIKVCPIKDCGFKTQEKIFYCPIHNVKLRIIRKFVNHPITRVRKNLDDDVQTK